MGAYVSAAEEAAPDRLPSIRGRPALKAGRMIGADQTPARTAVQYCNPSICPCLLTSLQDLEATGMTVTDPTG